MPESPVRTLYGRKGNVLFVPLDVCILQVAAGGGDEFRPAPEPARLIAAPIQEEGAGRIGLIAHYEWPPLLADHSVNPVVTVQLAPSASVRGIEDLRVLAPQVHPGDAVTIDLGSGTTISGTIHTEIGWCSYPDLLHHVGAYRVELVAHVDVRLHGSAVRLTGNGGLLGMLIATQNEPGGTCRALVYPT